jgi:hypothetical protein
MAFGVASVAGSLATMFFSSALAGRGPFGAAGGIPTALVMMAFVQAGAYFVVGFLFWYLAPTIAAKACADVVRDDDRDSMR